MQIPFFAHSSILNCDTSCSRILFFIHFASNTEIVKCKLPVSVAEEREVTQLRLPKAPQLSSELGQDMVKGNSCSLR